jgi:4-phospho-D-threonate 3-dehydrogenase / 4-phospho-D-erythronate 3-dehydrogenase
MASFTNRVSKRAIPRIGVTIGDPAGIGPEIVLKSLASPEIQALCQPVLIGDAQYLSDWAQIFGLKNGAPLGSEDLAVVVDRGRSLETLEPQSLNSSKPVIYNLGNLPCAVEMGRESAACGRAAGEYIEAAVELVRQGEIDAIATAPINKKSLHMGGYAYPGHTEFLAALTGVDDFAMSFFSPKLRVVLLTTHVPLMDVSSYVKRSSLERLIRLVHREFEGFGYPRPRIAVAALNPHGGEGALFGSEEALEMTPAIEACRVQNQPEGRIDVSGPHSGDTIFTRAARGEFDIVISCYHDQGLIPIKCFSFGEAVNVTLGLPFIRSSVDHGTAFDIAGKNLADHSSMIAAIKLAAELYQRRSTTPTEN